MCECMCREQIKARLFMLNQDMRAFDELMSEREKMLNKHDTIILKSILKVDDGEM